MLAADVQQIWNKARRELVEEYGMDKTKLMMAELLGLRMLAKDALDKSKPPAGEKRKSKKPFTR